MTYDPHPSLAPTYRGLQWIDGALPTELERWPRHRTRLQIDKTGDAYDIAHEELAAYAAGRMIEWPERPIYFLCDMHADTDAFFRSLVATGGVERTGPGDDDFKITAEGKRAIFIIGGDCIDKGPDNLRLLRALRRLIDRGADVELLTGNHDLRMLVGLIYGGARDPRHAHLFVRLGKKSIPLFREIFDHYIAGPPDPSKGPFAGRREFLSDAEVRAAAEPRQADAILVWQKRARRLPARRGDRRQPANHRLSDAARVGRRRHLQGLQRRLGARSRSGVEPDRPRLAVGSELRRRGAHAEAAPRARARTRLSAWHPFADRQSGTEFRKSAWATRV
jgi:hypothetical protein